MMMIMIYDDNNLHIYLCMYVERKWVMRLSIFNLKSSDRLILMHKSISTITYHLSPLSTKYIILFLLSLTTVTLIFIIIHLFLIIFRLILMRSNKALSHLSLNTSHPKLSSLSCMLALDL